MEMFLIVMALSLFGVLVSAALFSAATRGVDPVEKPIGDRKAVRPAQRFFADDARLGDDVRVPLDALLLQIERHVQLEQAAAESFHAAPTLQSLHSRTKSPLVH